MYVSGAVIVIVDVSFVVDVSSAPVVDVSGGLVIVEVSVDVDVSVALVVGVSGAVVVIVKVCVL